MVIEVGDRSVRIWVLIRHGNISSVFQLDRLRRGCLELNHHGVNTMARAICV